MPDQPEILRHRMLLRTLAARRQGATLRELAADYGVNQKTIHRDLLLLRRLGFQLANEAGDHGRKHWRLIGGGLPQLSFTLEEAAALYLGRQFLEPLAGTDFFHGAQSAFAKIRATLGDAPLRHLERLAAAFYHKSHGLSDYSQQGQLIDDLIRAIEDRRLIITYQSHRATEPVTHYDVHPYSVVWHKQALYLIAHRVTTAPSAPSSSIASPPSKYRRCNSTARLTSTRASCLPARLASSREMAQRITANIAEVDHPLMPKGVEHSRSRAGTCGGSGRSSVDAERR